MTKRDCFIFRAAANLGAESHLLTHALGHHIQATEADTLSLTIPLNTATFFCLNRTWCVQLFMFTQIWRGCFISALATVELPTDLKRSLLSYFDSFCFSFLAFTAILADAFPVPWSSLADLSSLRQFSTHPIKTQSQNPPLFLVTLTACNPAKNPRQEEGSAKLCPLSVQLTALLSGAARLTTMFSSTRESLGCVLVGALQADWDS